MPLKTRSKNQVLTLAELADKTGAVLEGDGSVEISSVAPIEEARSGSITFVANSTYAKYLKTTNASAVVLDLDTQSDSSPVLRHKNPYLIFAQIIDLLYPVTNRVEQGFDASAIINNSAKIDQTAAIGPHCVISKDVMIGSNTQLIAQVFIGSGTKIGNNCLIYPGVKIMDNCQIGNNVILHPGVVIGSDGFGFAESETGLKKIQQIGWVEIGNDVEIGANTTIDRGAIGPTKIGLGTKIDNLVQIAHNVEIGCHSIIVSQVGISGSTKIGNGVIIAGQAGVVGHIEIGDGVTVGAQAGVSKSIKPGQTVWGTPVKPIIEAKRIEASLRKLPELLKRVKKLEEKQS